MRTRAHRSCLRHALVACVGFGTIAVATEASAAPSPSNKISGRGGNFGLGLTLGDPTGFSLKYFMASHHAIQGEFGWAPLHHGDGRLGFDYLWHPGTFVSNADLDFLPYLGLGVGMAFWAGRYYYNDHDGDRRRSRSGGGAAMFIRAPILGLGFHWKKAPLDTMLEGSWSPYIILPHLRHGDISIKLRYYF